MPDMAEPMVAGAEQSKPDETTSIFIPKDALGDRECKPGEKLTFTVTAVDDQTGEVEAKIDGYDKPKSSGVNDAIDAMPDDGEEDM